jgi:hypothetical protein
VVDVAVLLLADLRDGKRLALVTISWTAISMSRSISVR